MAISDKEIEEFERLLRGEGVMTADGPRFGPQYQQIEYKSLYTR
jgi:hypothetical protein